MLSELLQERAIIQAPMAGVQGAELAIAVCEAGGIGSLPGAMLSSDALRTELGLIRSSTDAAFNVNFFCHALLPLEPAADAAWRGALAPFYQELGADGQAAAGPARQPFAAEALAVLAEFEPALVSFHFGLPSAELLAGVRRWGAYVLGCATSVEEALWLVERGVDGVIAQGVEAGGHQGSFLPQSGIEAHTTLELVQLIAAAVAVPVIAAGGIATRSDADAALAAGASAVQVGSAFLQADEARTSAIHRAALQCSAEGQTALTNVFSGRPARGIVNRLMREMGCMSALSPAFPHATAAVAPLRTAAEAQGSGDFSPLWSGGRGYLSEARPAAEITAALYPTKLD